MTFFLLRIGRPKRKNTFATGEWPIKFVQQCRNTIYMVTKNLLSQIEYNIDLNKAGLIIELLAIHFSCFVSDLGRNSTMQRVWRRKWSWLISSL
jgi:hypothetical protein